MRLRIIITSRSTHDRGDSLSSINRPKTTIVQLVHTVTQHASDYDVMYTFIECMHFWMYSCFELTSTGVIHFHPSI